MGMVTISGLPSTIMPNTTYSISVTVTRTNTVPQLAGFQMVALDANNNNAGTMSNPGPGSTIQTSGGRTYHEHNPAQPYTNNSVTFTVDWTSPASGSGTITMYAAANLANGNGSTSGDAIVTTTASGTLMGGGGPITVVVTGTNVSCFGGNDGTATAMASGGGGGPYNYMWSNGANTQTITNLPAGTYTVTVTNNFGGSGTSSITITQPPPLSVSIINQTNATCFNPLGSATAQASGGVGNYTYLWSTGASGATATLPAGTHAVTVTDGNNCTASTTVTILSNTTPPTAEAGPTKQINCTNPTVTLDGSGSSSGANFVYQWTTSNGLIISGANTLHPTVGAAGTYTLTVTNTENGCSASDNTSVMANFTTPTANAGPDMEITCADPAVQLDGTASSSGANISYQWSTNDGHIVSGANTATPIVDAAGTYQLTVTNTENGCTATDAAQVSADTLAPVADAGPDTTLTCASSTVVLDGSGSSSGANFSYLWTTPDGHIVEGDTTLTPSVDEPGTYVLTVTNTENGCTATDAAQVSADTLAPVADAGPDGILSCNTGFLLDGSNSTGSGPLAFNWTGPGIQGPADSMTVFVTAPGTYVLVVTDIANGCTDADTAVVTEVAPVHVTIDSVIHVLCAGDSTGQAFATATQGMLPYSFLWSNGDTTAVAMNLSAGFFSLTVTDSLGCTAADTAQIIAPPPLHPNATATGETAAGANDGTATANPSGGTPGYSYMWSTGDTTQQITGLPPGSYSVTVNDSNGCTASQTVVVNSFDCSSMSLSISATEPTCHGSADGTLTAEPAGGSEPYAYQWSTGANTQQITGLSAGTYSVTVTDASMCVLEQLITLAQPDELLLSAIEINHVSCHGGADGSATIEANGGTPPYSFLWSQGDTTTTVEQLPPGNYSAIVIDGHGCTDSLYITIQEPPALETTVTTTSETAVGAGDGTATAEASGGTAPYTWLWQTGDTTQQISGLSPGTYCVTTTDAHGCTSTACGIVNPFGCDSLQVAFDITYVRCAGEQNGAVTALPTGGTEPYTYSWSTGDTSQTLESLSAGQYQLTITDASGCTLQASATVNEPDSLALFITTSQIECPGGTADSTYVHVSGGTWPYGYLWSTGDTTSLLLELGPGSYTVTVTDANGCSDSLSVTISVMADEEPPVASAKDLTIELDGSGMAFISAPILDDGSSDNCGIDTMYLDRQAFNCTDVGSNWVILFVVDAAGNVASDSARITIVDSLAPQLTCPPSIEVTGCDSLVITYADPDVSDNCPPITLTLIEGLPSGTSFPEGMTTVSYEASDASGNTSTCSFTVLVSPSMIEPNPLIKHVTCRGGSDGAIFLTASGGLSPYAYQWSTGDTMSIIDSLPAGIYSVTITDSVGCVFVDSFNVFEPLFHIEITIDTIIPEILPPANQAGSVLITVSGGIPPYQVMWFLGDSLVFDGEDAMGLEGGHFYRVEVTDVAGCTVILDSIFVDQITSTAQVAGGGWLQSYPNPTSYRLQISYTFPAIRTLVLELRDAWGRTVWEKTVPPGVSGTLDIPVDALPEGIYWLLASDGNRAVSKKIVVMR